MSKKKIISDSAHQKLSGVVIKKNPWSDPLRIRLHVKVHLIIPHVLDCKALTLFAMTSQNLSNRIPDKYGKPIKNHGWVTDNFETCIKEIDTLANAQIYDRYIEKYT